MSSTVEARNVLSAPGPKREESVVIDLGVRLGLTSGEQRVFSRILLGESYKEVAASLGCSVKNVEFHVSNILRRTHAPSMKKLLAAISLAQG